MNLLSAYDKNHIGDLIAGQGDWFTAQLLRLCAKADDENLVLLSKGFPEVVEAYLKWRTGEP